MNNYSQYFKTVSYSPKLFLGDRVRGFWNKIPFVGTVFLDTLVDEFEGPYLVIGLDLPIKFENNWHNFIKIKHTDLIDIKGKYELNRKTNRKKSAMVNH
jgi:hypothetical protein